MNAGKEYGCPDGWDSFIVIGVETIKKNKKTQGCKYLFISSQFGVVLGKAKLH